MDNTPPKAVFEDDSNLVENQQEQFRSEFLYDSDSELSSHPMHFTPATESSSYCIFCAADLATTQQQQTTSDFTPTDNSNTARNVFDDNNTDLELNHDRTDDVVPHRNVVPLRNLIAESVESEIPQFQKRNWSDDQKVLFKYILDESPSGSTSVSAVSSAELVWPSSLSHIMTERGSSMFCNVSDTDTLPSSSTSVVGAKKREFLILKPEELHTFTNFIGQQVQKIMSELESNCNQMTPSEANNLIERIIESSRDIIDSNLNRSTDSPSAKTYTPEVPSEHELKDCMNGMSEKQKTYERMHAINNEVHSVKLDFEAMNQEFLMELTTHRQCGDGAHKESFEQYQQLIERVQALITRLDLIEKEMPSSEEMASFADDFDYREGA